jgi:tRNA-intron endonuclease
LGTLVVSAAQGREGRLPMSVRGRCEANGVLLGIRVIIFDHSEARRVYSMGFYGKPLGISKPRDANFEAPLELGLMEAVYLAEKGVLCVTQPGNSAINVEELKAYAEEKVPRFNLLYRVYRELRDKGYVVRSGLKYGADFAVYERGPGLEHAPYLVHVHRPGTTIDPLDIVRAGRLSHSVRKDFILAVVGGSDIRYLLFSWSKP